VASPPSRVTRVIDGAKESICLVVVPDATHLLFLSSRLGRRVATSAMGVGRGLPWRRRRSVFWRAQRLGLWARSDVACGIRPLPPQE
jgi:hypothetical protein